ncbi:MAG: branched-chain amino acid transport system II carrier protein [Chlamydiia bacterium]
MRTLRAVLGVGFALFSMFFGSGNLIFPLLVGFQTASHPIWSSIGIILSGVILPFVGVYAMMLYGGDQNRFFRFFGERGTLVFTFVSLALMGPFGVLARCLTVMHGGVEQFYAASSLSFVSALFCLLIFGLSIKRGVLIQSIGGILTPFLLLSLALLVYFGLQHEYIVVSSLNAKNAFLEGFFQGYQTMDLLAALFFSTFILGHLDRLYPNAPEMKRKIFLRASLVGASLLSLVYLSLVHLSAHFHVELVNIEPQMLLPAVAKLSLGAIGGYIVAVASILACLTTAVVLTYLFAEFLQKQIPFFASKYRAIGVTLLIAFMTSTLEFSGIARILGPLLEISYPFIIALTATNILLAHWQKKELA